MAREEIAVSTHSDTVLYEELSFVLHVLLNCSRKFTRLGIKGCCIFYVDLPCFFGCVGCVFHIFVVIHRLLGYICVAGLSFYLLS